MMEGVASLFVGHGFSGVEPDVIVAELIASAGFVEIFCVDSLLGPWSRSTNWSSSTSWIGFRRSFEDFWRGTWCREDRGEEKCGGEEALEFHGAGAEADVQCPPTITDT